MASAEPTSGVARLAVVLLQTFGAILIGFLCIRLKFIDVSKGEMKSIGFYVGKIAFPTLLFRTVATANIGDVSWLVIIACTVAKALAYILVFALTYFCNTGPTRMPTAAIFAFFVVASNDFAVGFPVIDALYPTSEYPDDNMSTYLAINALALTVLFIPLTLVLLSIGKKGSSNSGRLTRKDAWDIMKSIILNPVMIMTIVGLVFQFAWPGDLSQGLPTPLGQMVDIVVTPFTMLALFLTGASLKGLRLCKWSSVLVIFKVLFCAFVGAGLAQFLIAGTANTKSTKVLFVNFSYLYGSIPTSSAPLVFAADFAPESAELIATAIVLGLMVAGPTMFLSSVLFADGASCPSTALQELSKILDFVSLPCFALFLAILVLARRWFWKAPMDIVAAYGLAAGFYAIVKMVLIKADDCGLNKDQQEMYVNCGHKLFMPIPLAIVFGIAQNLCRAMALLLFLWRVRGFPAGGSKRAIAATACLACIVGAITPPNTFNEICAIQALPMAVWRTTGTVLLYVAVLLGVFAMRRRELPEPQQDHKVAQGRLLLGLAAPRSALQPTATNSALGIYLAVRLLMEAVLGAVIGSFGDSLVTQPFLKQMLIVEELLEHSQMPFFLLCVLLNAEFQPVLRRLCSRREGRSVTRNDLELHATFDALDDESQARLKTRRLLCYHYDACISGAELVTLVLDIGETKSRMEAAALCSELCRVGFIARVDRQGGFYDCEDTWFRLHTSGSLETTGGGVTPSFARLQTPFMDDVLKPMPMPALDEDNKGNAPLLMCVKDAA